MNILLLGVKSDSPFILKFAAGSLAGTYLQHTYKFVCVCITTLLYYPVNDFKHDGTPNTSHCTITYLTD